MLPTASDSLLESSAFESQDGELFGSRVGMATTANNAAWDALQTNLGQGVDDLDDLSDFENSDADADSLPDDDSWFGRPGSGSPVAVVAQPVYGNFDILSCPLDHFRHDFDESWTISMICHQLSS